MADEEDGGKLIHAPEFGYTGDVDGLVRQIQTDGRETELASLVGQVWQDIAAAVAPERKPRY